MLLDRVSHVNEVRERAREICIEGRSSMNKDDLIEALREHQVGSYLAELSRRRNRESASSAKPRTPITRMTAITWSYASWSLALRI